MVPSMDSSQGIPPVISPEWMQAAELLAMSLKRIVYPAAPPVESQPGDLGCGMVDARKRPAAAAAAVAIAPVRLITPSSTDRWTDAEMASKHSCKAQGKGSPSTWQACR